MPRELRPIVIVDDDSDDAFFTERQMKKIGIVNPIFRFSSGEEAITFLERLCLRPASEQELPCVVFLDIKMPGLTGHEVLAWARGQTSLVGVKFVMLSSSDDPDDIARAYELGADKYLRKHPPVENLRQLVSEVSCVEST